MTDINNSPANNANAHEIYKDINFKNEPNNFEAEDSITKKFLDLFERRKIKPEPRIVNTPELPSPLGLSKLEKAEPENQFQGKKFDENIECPVQTSKLIPQIIGLLTGLIIVMSSFFILFDDLVPKIMMVIIGFIFACFLGSKIQQLTYKYIIKKGGIEMRDLGAGKYIPWVGIKQVKMRYAAKQFYLSFKDSMGVSMHINGSVKNFPIICACIAQSVRMNRIPLDELTIANFANLGHLFSHHEFTDEELEEIRTLRGGGSRIKIDNTLNNNGDSIPNNNAKPKETAEKPKNIPKPVVIEDGENV